MGTDDSLIVRFLAENDAPCPSCGYSLRGCQQPACPECGDEITLSVRGESSHLLIKSLRYLLLALLVHATITFVWIIGSAAYFGLQGSYGYLGAPWLLHLIVSGASHAAVALTCVMALRRLNTVTLSSRFAAVAQLVKWTGILVVATVILGVLMSLTF